MTWIMGIRFDEYLQTSRRGRSTASRARQETFRRAYSMAVQVIELRQERGLTQQQLSALTGIAQSEISRIERGVISPTFRTLSRLADALGAEIRLVDVSEGCQGASRPAG